MKRIKKRQVNTPCINPHIKKIMEFHKGKALFIKLAYSHQPKNISRAMEAIEETVHFIAEQYAYYQPTKPEHFVLVTTRYCRGQHIHYVIMDRLRQEALDYIWPYGGTTISTEPPGMKEYCLFKPENVHHIIMNNEEV